ncbi:hypothetical protein [Dyadobacter bucti]|jgi:hypothetical protein|uniref:hypothetical protein n=1 Tax=Dyadobacter bucti TaxID=2572203 RepID=UPI001409809E|nr:hypothetical protein [Dyadobacter bucti]
MANVLKMKSSTPDIFGVIELNEGVGYYVAEFECVPVEPHLPATYDLFDEEITIEDLEEYYQVDLASYELVPLEK